jgi:hypothetical protein
VACARVLLCWGQKMALAGLWTRCARGWGMMPRSTLNSVGLLLLIFVLVAAVVSLALGVVIPLSVTANRWLVAALALGCLLSRL